MRTKTSFIICSIIFNFFFSNSILHAKKSADYVIVGVGTAGGLLAKKLSDDRKTSVIALHRGQNLTQDPEIKYSKNAITTVASSLIGPPFFINGETTPQPNADNRELLWAMAVPEGGASSINAGAWARGTNELFSQWEAIVGPLWSVPRILKIYKKLENYHGKTDSPCARGYHGPLDVRQVPHPSKVSKTFSKAINAGTGFPFVLDYNDPKTSIGVSPQFQYTQKGANGRLRVSSATAFLNRKVMTPNGQDVAGRKLRVLFDSIAMKILWEGNRAIGVEYLHDGKVKTIFANKEVIICAGLFSSPFLLYSGVGPASLLNSLGIPVIADNPNVGQGLVDQPMVLTVFTSNPDDFPRHNINSPFDEIAWLPSPGGDPQIREIRFATTTPIPGLSLGLVDLLQPKSRGSITINSPDPLAFPVINYGAFSDPSDLALYQSTFQTYLKSIHLALQAIDPLYQLVRPEPAILDDLALLTDYLKENVGSNQSFQSHCRMAPLDQGGVVDSTGHVYGVQNVIVADDSIAPLCMDGATMASAYLIAANIAQILIDQQRHDRHHLSEYEECPSTERN